MRDRGILAALIVLMALAPASAQGTRTMDREAFANELGRIADAISRGEPGHVPVVSVPPVWTIESDGERIDVSTAWLSRGLDEARRDPSAWPVHRSRLLARVEAARSEAASAARLPGARTPANALAVLEEVLSAAEFKQLHQRSALSLFRQRASEWLLRLWQRLGGSTLGGRRSAIVFAFLATLLTLGVLTMWVVRLVLQPSRDGRFTLTPPAARQRSARAWAREALKAADPREAIRCAYRATIRALEEEGAWQADETRTPREYLRLLAAGHRRRGVLGDMTRRFEEICYAAREATVEDRAAALARLEELGCLRGD